MPPYHDLSDEVEEALHLRQEVLEPGPDEISSTQPARGDQTITVSN